MVHLQCLEGKVAMISGTAGGQGRAAALAFAAAGAKIVGSDVKSSEADETVRMVRDRGGAMESIHPLDLSTLDGAQQWTKFALSCFGGIDILYNNAGSLHGRSAFGETTLEEWDLCIRHELTMAFICSRAVWPHMIERGGGLILNTASVAGHMETLPLHAPIHGVAKAGTMALTRMLAAEGASYGIRSISISPGLIRSPATIRFWDGDERMRALGAALTAKIPLGRAGECDEIANVAVFLASPAAAYLNATDILVDGGMRGVSFNTTP